eukprot:13179082-Ditylum_brightwellii.AAC.1
MDRIWLVTYGGKADNDEYYGWVLATDSTILWEGKGYVQSNPDLLESQCMEGMSHLSIMVQTEKMYNDMSLNTNTEWVKGHQDLEPGIKSRLTWQAQLNIRADQLETEARHEITDAQRKGKINLLPA